MKYWILFQLYKIYIVLILLGYIVFDIWSDL